MKRPDESIVAVGCGKLTRRQRVADGTITVSYRLWSRPKVKVGVFYRSGSVTIETDGDER